MTWASHAWPAAIAARPRTSTCLIDSRVISRRVTSVEVSTTVTVEGTRASPVWTGLKSRTRCRYSEEKYT